MSAWGHFRWFQCRSPDGATGSPSLFELRRTSRSCPLPQHPWRDYLRAHGLISPVAVFSTIGLGDSLMPKNN